jgi:uncharacterized membrane protein
MAATMKAAMFLHLIGAVVWIGGMFFAYFALRPAAAALEPTQRLPLWAETLGRFFRWVWISVTLVLGSGFYMLTAIAGVTRVPVNIHVMLYVGVLMTFIFAYVFLLPFAALKQAVAARDWGAGAAALATIRKAVAVNLALGLVNVAVATVGQI